MKNDNNRPHLRAFIPKLSPTNTQNVKLRRAICGLGGIFGFNSSRGSISGRWSARERRTCVVSSSLSQLYWRRRWIAADQEWSSLFFLDCFKARTSNGETVLVTSTEP
ncbi:hypothetical protein GWI33_012967 [Rhynchophorus ferrugineus]|uniref:Uncharacterized protein n=1 Tax=Rhynchophorus ferrugineus TaxID=354439 RepID=A0A834MAG1_RHYFE|nr:hypothetical protein GWI33_012967 [Rhynchophorus ferrugineus]